MKSLKLLISILIIFAIGIVFAIICILNMKSNEQNEVIINIDNNANNNIINENTEIEDEIPTLTFNTSLQKISANSILYAISNNINKYFNYIKERKYASNK